VLHRVVLLTLKNRDKPYFAVLHEACSLFKQGDTSVDCENVHDLDYTWC